MALAEQYGVDVARARRCLTPPTLNAALPSGLHPTLYARLTRESRTLEPEHLVQAALEDPEARRLLNLLGILEHQLLELAKSTAHDPGAASPNAVRTAAVIAKSALARA